jgi:hypothetical protein
MAEFLIMKKRHWTAKLTPEQHEEMRKKHKHWDEKIACQYIPGDVIEVRPDGFWTGAKARGFNKKAFRVISVPNAKAEFYQYLHQSSPTQKSRYNISTGGGDEIKTVNSMNDLTITDKG